LEIAFSGEEEVGQSRVKNAKEKGK